jgi:hypothetical protein
MFVQSAVLAHLFVLQRLFTSVSNPIWIKVIKKAETSVSAFFVPVKVKMLKKNERFIGWISQKIKLKYIFATNN